MLVREDVAQEMQARDRSDFYRNLPGNDNPRAYDIDFGCDYCHKPAGKLLKLPGHDSDFFCETCRDNPPTD